MCAKTIFQVKRQNKNWRFEENQGTIIKHEGTIIKDYLNQLIHNL